MRKILQLKVITKSQLCKLKVKTKSQLRKFNVKNKKQLRKLKVMPIKLQILSLGDANSGELKKKGNMMRKLKKLLVANLML